MCVSYCARLTDNQKGKQQETHGCEDLLYYRFLPGMSLEVIVVRAEQGFLAHHHVDQEL